MPTSSWETQGKYITAQKITKIPETILRHNFTFPDYCVQNFQSISYITHTTNKQVKNQYILAKSKNEIESKASFNGLESLLKTKFKPASCDVFTKSDNDYEGLIVVQGEPSHGKFIHESSETEDSSFERPLSSFDHCVDALLNSNKNHNGWIISTISKTKFIPRFPSPKKLKITLPFVLWLIFLVGITVFLVNRIQNAYALVSLIPSVAYPIIKTIEYLKGDILFIRYSVFLGLFLVATFLGVALYFNQRRKLKRNLDENPNNIAKRKIEQAKDNHREDMKKIGAVKQSFIVLIRGENKEDVLGELESLKRTIQGIFSGSIFKVSGTIIVPQDKSIKNVFRRITNWTLESFWSKFYKVIPFKPTLLSIPRAGSNYFRFIQEKFIPGTEIIEGSTYKIPIERSIGDWYLGKVYRKIGQESYPYYITPDVLNQQGLLIGQTGRGKTFFMYKLLEQMNKFNPEIHYCIFDLKGGEYSRFFAKKSLVLIPGSEEAPLGINIFRINESDIESNKRVVMHLLNNFIVHTISDSTELSAFMKDIINQAVDRVFLQSTDNRTMRIFVQKIDEVLNELGDDGLGWIEKTRTALKARFRELFTGWFQHIFCVTESNFKAEMLHEKNIIFKLNHLISDNDLPTVKFLVNAIMSLVSSYAKELRDLSTDNPWLVCVFEEAQKIVPNIHKKDSSEASIVENFVEIARAHRVSSIAIGQNPSKISDRFHQAGFIIDFGTESDVLDKVVFGKDFLRAPEEKEQLTSSQMCFVKIVGEKRVLLKVDDYDYSNVLTDNQLNILFEQEPTYQLLRDQYQLEPVVLEDLEGKKGKRRLSKQKLISYCQQNCSMSSNGCPSFDGSKFTKHKLPRKSKKQLQEMLAKENGNSFLRFCHHLAKDKKDALCILLHYVLRIVQNEILDDIEAQELLLLRGELYFQSLIEEQEFLQEIEQTESLTEVEHELSVVDKPREFIKYSFNFKRLLIEEGDSE